MGRITEYRVVGIDYETRGAFEEVDYIGEDIDMARCSYEELKGARPAFDRVRFQRRTITTSDWRLVPPRDRVASREGEAT